MADPVPPNLWQLAGMLGRGAAPIGQGLMGAGQSAIDRYQAMPSWADRASEQLTDPRSAVAQLLDPARIEAAMGMVGGGTIKGRRLGLSRGAGANEKFTRPADPTAELTAASQPMTDEAFQNALNDPAARLQRLYGRYGGTPPTEPRPLASLPSSDSLAIPPSPSAADLARASRVETVPLSQVKGTNQMQPDRFRSGNHPPPLVSGYGDMPIAVRKENGEFLIFDGHHRIATNIGNGIPEMKMYVIDAKSYAPEFAGRKVVPPSMSDNDLLRELGVTATAIEKGSK